MTTFDDLNVIHLEGVMLGDAEVRTTSRGATLAHFTLASTRSYLRNGERIELVSYIDVEAWGAAAEVLREEGTRATRVRISGTLVQDTFASSGRHGPLKVVAERVVVPHAGPAEKKEKASATPRQTRTDDANEEPLLSREEMASAFRRVVSSLAGRSSTAFTRSKRKV